MALLRRAIGSFGASRAEPYLLLFLVALALVLRVARLSFQPLWWDEGYSVFFATRDFGTMLARTAVDIHPPLYYAILQGWIAIFGKSDIALRLLSVVIGVGTLPLLFVVARQLANLLVAWVAVLLLAVSPLHIYYSQEVRMYGLVTLLALATIALWLDLSPKGGGAPSSSPFPPREGGQGVRSREGGQGVRFLAYILVTAAGLYSHYFFVFVLAAQILIVLLRRHDRRGLRRWLLAWTAVLLLYLPWLLYAAPKLYSYVTSKVVIEQYSQLDPLTFLEQHIIAFSVGHLSDWTWLTWGALVTFAFVAVGLLSIMRAQGRPLDVTLPFLVFVPLTLGWLVNLVYTFGPTHYERLLLFSAPLFLLLAAVGWEWLWSRNATLAVAGLALVVAVDALSLYGLFTIPRYTAEDYRPLVAEIQELALPTDTVLAPYPWQIGYLASYYQGAPLHTIEIPGDQWDAQRSEWESRLMAMRSEGARIWLIAYQVKGRRLEDQIANLFASDYRLLDNWYGNTRLEYFGITSDPSIVDRPTEYSSDLHLVSYGASNAPLSAGSSFVPIYLHWRNNAGGWSYSLRLVDSRGDKAVQEDFPLPTGNEIERQGLVIPRSLSPGDYRVSLVVYNSADSSPLRLPNGETELTLSTVRVMVATQ